MHKTFRQKQGFATLTLVILLAFIAVMVVAAISLKILVGVERTRSVADSIQSSYAAESAVNDVILRYVKYPGASFAPGTITLPDGTQLITTRTTDIDDNMVIGILAKRPFSSFKLELTKKSEVASESFPADIVLSLDCTGSMIERADPRNPSAGTRLHVLEEATKNFLQALQDEGYDGLRIGVSVFTGDAVWLKTLSGTEITPTNNIPIPDIISAIDVNFNDDPDESPICLEVDPHLGTSQGTGLRFMNKYFAMNPDSTRKQIEVLITDGDPLVAIPDTACQEMKAVPYSLRTPLVSSYCPNHTQKFGSGAWECIPVGGSYMAVDEDNDNSYPVWKHAQWDLACQLAPKSITLNGNSYGVGNISVNGQRDANNVDTYILTVFDVTNSRNERLIWFRNTVTQYATDFFDMPNASLLSTTLINRLLPTIKTSINNFTIRKVIP